ncbi:MAG: hypothetical protein QM689_07640 [Oscillospiraceae bacterium]
MKKILAAALAFVLTASMVSCGDDDDDKSKTKHKTSDSISAADSDSQYDDTDAATEETTGEATESTTEEFQYGDDYIAAHLGDEYSITYAYKTYGSTDGATEIDMTFSKTPEGCYYKYGNEAGSEILYIKNGDMYDYYIRDTAEDTFKIVQGVRFKQEDIETSAASFLGYMDTYQDYADELEKTGTETVAGRDCDIYADKNNVVYGSLGVQYAIDQETGACLKFSVEYKDGESAAGYSFECTEFKTEGVTLPAYEK